MTYKSPNSRLPSSLETPENSSPRCFLVTPEAQAEIYTLGWKSNGGTRTSGTISTNQERGAKSFFGVSFAALPYNVDDNAVRVLLKINELSAELYLDSILCDVFSEDLLSVVLAQDAGVGLKSQR